MLRHPAVAAIRLPSSMRATSGRFRAAMVADFVVNELDRKPMGFFTVRDGNSFFSPIAGVYGPKVMLINESAGSGGDALPYYFKL